MYATLYYQGDDSHHPLGFRRRRLVTCIDEVWRKRTALTSSRGLAVGVHKLPPPHPTPSDPISSPFTSNKRIDHWGIWGRRTKVSTLVVKHVPDTDLFTLMFLPEEGFNILL